MSAISNSEPPVPLDESPPVGQGNTPADMVMAPQLPKPPSNPPANLRGLERVESSFPPRIRLYKFPSPHPVAPRRSSRLAVKALPISAPGAVEDLVHELHEGFMALHHVVKAAPLETALPPSKAPSPERPIIQQLSIIMDLTTNPLDRFVSKAPPDPAMLAPLRPLSPLPGTDRYTPVPTSLIIWPDTQRIAEDMRSVALNNLFKRLKIPVTRPMPPDEVQAALTVFDDIFVPLQHTMSCRRASRMGPASTTPMTNIEKEVWTCMQGQLQGFADCMWSFIDEFQGVSTYHSGYTEPPHIPQLSTGPEMMWHWPSKPPPLPSRVSCCLGKKPCRLQWSLTKHNICPPLDEHNALGLSIHTDAPPAQAPAPAPPQRASISTKPLATAPPTRSPLSVDPLPTPVTLKPSVAWSTKLSYASTMASKALKPAPVKNKAAISKELKNINTSSALAPPHPTMTHPTPLPPSGLSTQPPPAAKAKGGFQGNRVPAPAPKDLQVTFKVSNSADVKTVKSRLNAADSKSCLMWLSVMDLM
ncbi:hypothetical protein CTheo_8876 [Ceratobasidium theobromae]|uniref:Uncharacterized protein n=1 Tax=Ceratobasidium theobromae TaxID=1582974 RepID=A0A5N5Q863_9AGAM|nr:hypothetical protein CTheo_8876 [Ceratobasidium theobromae]